MNTLTSETRSTPLIEERATPDLFGWFDTRFTTDRPEWTLMTEVRRSELIERLLARSLDPDGLDWDFIDSRD